MMDGIELAARFSYITNVLRFCGPEEAAEKFLSYLRSKERGEDVRDVIKRFEGLYPYLSVIAERTGRDWLDHDVVEAYWIGNALLDELSDDDLRRSIDLLEERGLPKSIAAKARDELPSGFNAQHTFNVMYVGVGNLTGSVAVTLPNMQQCRPSWGVVRRVAPGQLTVTTEPLLFEDGRYRLGAPETGTVNFLPAMLSSVAEGDVVAIHWGFAPLVLSEEQAANIKKYSVANIEAMNAYLDSRSAS